MSWFAVLGLAIGGAFVFEGAMWALAPKATREAYRQAFEALSAEHLQWAGVGSVALGAVIVVLCARGLG